MIPNSNNVEILSIGTELLLGNIVNTNAQWISEQLSQLGLNHFRQSTVGDNFDRIIKVIQEISKRSNLLITTGGLGPTPDDLTTEAIAKSFDVSIFESLTYGTKLNKNCQDQSYRNILLAYENNVSSQEMRK